MKTFAATINITLRKSILDVQGKTVENALHSMEFPMLTNIRIGKHVELKVQAENKETAYSLVEDASRQLIANPIIEDFIIEIAEI